MYPNLYASIIFDIPDKIREYIKTLDNQGQIDRDSNYHPYLIKVNLIRSSTYQVFIVRNGKVENFIINTRKRSEPICTWNLNDGFKREDKDKENMTDKSSEPTNKERLKKYGPMVESILS